MYSANNTLFPAYSGLDDIRVSMPNAPTRASAMRNTAQLWDIHTSEPHVSAPSDPGGSVPYPDNGFNPEGLSESSEANTIVNRASAHLSAEDRNELCSDLDTLYTKRLVSDLQLSNMNVGELKEHILQDCPGALLVYNGSDKDSLIKAFSLCKSLETLTSQAVDKSVSPIDEKAKLLSFVSCCEAIREAMLYPDYKIRQMLMGSTDSRDSLDEALESFCLSDDNYLKVNPSDEFKDHKDAIALCELELEITCNLDVMNGNVGKSLQNCLNQILPHIRSFELRNALASTIGHTQRLANKSVKSHAKKSKSALKDLQKSMHDVGVVPELTQGLQGKIARANELEALDVVHSKVDSQSAKGASRSSKELQRVANLLKSAGSSLQRNLNMPMDALAKLCTVAELYTIMCMQDCCIALSLGEDTRLKECAENLHKALCAELRQSGIPHIQKLRADVHTAHKDLHSAQSSKTMEALEAAKSNNTISDRKLQTISNLIG